MMDIAELRQGEAILVFELFEECAPLIACGVNCGVTAFQYLPIFEVHVCRTQLYRLNAPSMIHCLNQGAYQSLCRLICSCMGRNVGFSQPSC